MVFVHGFTQSGASWTPVAAALPDSIARVLPDVPDGLDFVATAGALGDLGGRAVYVGYSMGGRLCLQLALDRPDLVERLVLVSASPGIADDAERAARRASAGGRRLRGPRAARSSAPTASPVRAAGTGSGRSAS